MSGQPRGYVWVDPEGVIQLGDSYAEHGTLYESYATQLEQLRVRYGKSWGDDDMGQQFSQKFLEGLDALDSIVGSVKGTLHYTANGLRESGKLYRTSDEQAYDMSNQLAGGFEDLPQGAFLNRRPVDESPPATATPQLRAQRMLLPGETRRHAVEGQEGLVEATPQLRGERMLRPGETPRNVVEGRNGVVVDGPQVFSKSVRPGERVEAVQARPARTLRRLTQPDEVVASDETEMRRGEVRPGILLSRRPVEPGLEPLDETPLLPRVEASQVYGPGLSPLMSASYFTAQWHDVHIDGVPLAPGYHLQGFMPLDDGTVHLDANRFESISPLTPDLRVTGADGGPIDLGDGPVFVVKDNPAVDPGAPGYEPLYVSFAPDGTAVPIVTDL
ncbi:hypothetical protein [Actinoplanes sp. NPDC049316]|uniref:hypothetical protein n=1 Tax=Actinoplanes sp. NPDC049316 TaxID=3154727 RepID=UPI003412D2F2